MLSAKWSGAESFVTTRSASVLCVSHPHVPIEGLVLDGQYGAHDTVVANGDADFLTLRNLEVRRSTKDLVYIQAASTVELHTTGSVHQTAP